MSSLEAFNEALVHAVHVRLGRESLDPSILDRGYQFFGGKKPSGHVYTEDEIFWGGSRNHDVNGNAGVAVGYSDDTAYGWWKPRVQKEQRLGSNQIFSPHYDPWTLAGAFAVSYFGVWDKQDEAVFWARKLLAYMVGGAAAVQHKTRPKRGICHAAFGGKREHHNGDVFPSLPGPFFGASGGRSIFPVGGSGPDKHHPSAGRFFRGILEVYHLALGIKSNPPSNVYHADFPHALIEMMASTKQPDAHLFGISEDDRKALRVDGSNRIDPEAVHRLTSGFQLMGRDGKEDAEYHVFRYKNGDVWTVFEDDVFGTKPGALASRCTDEVFECWSPADYRSDKHDRRGSARWDGKRGIVLEHPDPDEEWELRLPPESDLVQCLTWKGQTGFVEHGGEFVPAPTPAPPVDPEPVDEPSPAKEGYAPTPHFLAGAAVLDGWYSPRGRGRAPKRVANAGAWGVADDLSLDMAGSEEWLRTLYSKLVDDARGNFALSLYDPRFPETLENICKVWRDHFVGRLWVAPYFDPGSFSEPLPLSARNIANAVETWFRTFKAFLDPRMWAEIDGRKVVAIWLPEELNGSTTDVLVRASELIERETGFSIHWSDAGHNADKHPHSINGLFYTALRHGILDAESGWTMAQPGFWDAFGGRYLARRVDRFREALERNPAARVRIVPFNEWTEGSQVVEPAVVERTVDDVFGDGRKWDEPHSVTNRDASWGGDPRAYLDAMAAVFDEHLAQNRDEEPVDEPPADPPLEVDRSDWIDPSTLPAPVSELVELYEAVTRALEPS